MAAAPEHHTGSLKEQIAKVFEVSLKVTVPDEPDVAPLIAVCSKKEAADYQWYACLPACLLSRIVQFPFQAIYIVLNILLMQNFSLHNNSNNAMCLWSKIKGKGTEFRGPQPVGQAIMRNLPTSDMIESCSIAGPGFINVKLSTQWIAKRIQNMLTDGIDTWAPRLSVKRAIVDFSSPNIAKEMHVGHLRSTIIGDTIARMLEYAKVDVLRRNHVGDWGTQFGMLIEFLFEKFPDGEVTDQDIGELELFYKASKQRFDGDDEFKERARKAVVALQSGKEEKYQKAWAQICEISRRGFEKVYERLGVHLEEMGESFYNPYIPLALKELNDKGLIKDDEGAKVIKIIEGKKALPLVATEKDGRYSYASTDFAALWSLLPEEEVKWIIFVILQSGTEEKYQKAWAQICEINRKGSKIVYQRQGVHLGESLNNTYIPLALEELDDEGLIEDDEDAKVIKIIEGNKVPPLIVTKTDGGYNYASTDLAALWYRLNEEKAEWIIYVTDVGQREHFKKIFTAAKSAGWLPADESKYPKTSHVGFGLVLGDDRKRFRTRSTEVVKLVDLLDKAKTRCKEALVGRVKVAEWTAEELEQTAEAVGYGAVKYADLKNNRLTNYTFNYDQMLNDKACLMIFSHFYMVILQYICCMHMLEYVRLSENLEGQMLLQTDDERKLGLHLLQFAEAVEEACTNLLPNVLCEYLYDLSEKFTSFYSECKVVGSAEETSRLLLCEATAVVMRKCFHLLGITPVYKI
ncbi:putative arginine--tRNA ligase [Helianthus annuus]|nr:putative arginine--tRNA ligase [Helianthus annuus]